jgi:hypothetical protein
LQSHVTDEKRDPHFKSSTMQNLHTHITLWSTWCPKSCESLLLTVARSGTFTNVLQMLKTGELVTMRLAAQYQQ